jgi:hypothetical protein
MPKFVLLPPNGSFDNQFDHLNHPTMKPSVFALSVSIALFSCLITPVFAQNAFQERFTKRNSLQVNSILGLSYERLLFQSARHKVFAGLHTGVTTTVESSEPFPFRRGWQFGGTLSVDYSLGIGSKNRHHLDVGLSYGANQTQFLAGTQRSSWSSTSGFMSAEEDVYWTRNTNHFILPRIGYRFQKPGGGFTWRGGLSPFIQYLPPSSRNLPRSIEWLPLPYASLGWSF